MGVVYIMNKKYYYVLGLVLLCSLFFFSFSGALSLNIFSNEEASENITFSGNQNITRNIKIYRNANVTSAFMNLSGYSSMGECFQETANVSTACGGLSTGQYNFNYGILQITYKKPSDLFNVTWQVKHGCLDTYTVNIPDSCINYDNESILLRLISYTTYGTGTDTASKSYGQCYNGSWNTITEINSTSTLGSITNDSRHLLYDENYLTGQFFSNDISRWMITTSGDCIGGMIYEEGIKWIGGNITNPYIQINNTQIWNYNGAFNSTFSPNKTEDFSSILNTALNNGNCDCMGCTLIDNDCNIPIIFHSDNVGNLTYSDIEINYTTKPFITLISPENNSFSPSLETLICNAVDEIGINNLSFNIWNSTGNSLDLLLNKTTYYEFEGNNKINYNNSVASENFTIAIWFKHKETTTNWKRLFEDGGYGKGGYSLQTGIAGSDSVTFYTGSATGWNTSVGFNVTRDEWTHFVGTFNGTTLIVYKNGVEQNRTESEYTSPLNSPNREFANNYNGYMDEIRIYNKTLNSTEVSTVYNYGREEIQGETTRLIGLYHLNYTTIAKDSSTNNNNGNISDGINLELSNIVNFTSSDIYKWNCVSYNKNNAFNSANYNSTLNVDIDVTIINSLIPINNAWVNQNNGNIIFYYTPSHSTQILDTCKLYSNWTGSWEENQINDSIIINEQNNFSVDLSELDDSLYKWTVWCNTTIGSESFSQLGNYTLGMDSISPTINTVTITTTLGSQSVSLSTNSTDINLDSCRYTVYNLAGGVDGTNENIVFKCSESTSFSTSSYATYNLSVIVNDSAGNEKITYTAFTTSPITEGQAGGGTTLIIGGEAGWIMEVKDGVARYDKKMLQGTSLKLSVQFENIGDSSRELTLVCEDKQGDVCRFVAFPETTFTLPLLKDTKLRKTFKITIPEDYEIGDYQFNIKAIDDLSRSGEITVFLTVSEGGTLLSIFTKLGSSTESGIPYLLIFTPVLIFSIILSSILLKKVPLRPVWVILVSILLSFGSIMFI